MWREALAAGIEDAVLAERIREATRTGVSGFRSLGPRIADASF